MIEDLAARQRLEAAAATQRRAKRQSDAAFWDGQGASNSGGNSIPVTTGSNGPLRLGQSTPLLRSGGSAQIDAFSAMRSDEPLIPLPPKTYYKQLALVNLGGQLKLYVRSPKAILELPQPANFNYQGIQDAIITSTGAKIKDFIVLLTDGFKVARFDGLTVSYFYAANHDGSGGGGGGGAG